MKSTLLIILMFFALLATTRTAFAAKYHWKFLIEFKEQSIGDQETKIAVGDWTCIVGKPDLDSVGTESRRLGCSVTDGLQAYVLKRCFVDKKTGKTRTEGADVINLQQKKIGSTAIMLTCE